MEGVSDRPGGSPNADSGENADRRGDDETLGVVGPAADVARPQVATGPADSGANQGAVPDRIAWFGP